MQINWFGQSYFQIATLSKTGEKVVLAIDPYSEETGLKPPSFEADIALLTHQHEDHNNLKVLRGNPFVISGPGEYEIKGIFINGIQSFHDEKKGAERGQNTIYTIEAEELKICHLGDLGEDLSEAQLEKIGQVDILMVPAGGGPTISVEKASKTVNEIEPKIVIPMHFKIPKLKYGLEDVSLFLKKFGVDSIDPLPKLSIKKKDLSSDEAKIIVLAS